MVVAAVVLAVVAMALAVVAVSRVDR